LIRIAILPLWFSAMERPRPPSGPGHGPGALDDAADAPALLPGLREMRLDPLGFGRGGDHDETDAHVEGPVHVLRRHASIAPDRLEDRQDGPAAALHARAAPLRQDPR